MAVPPSLQYITIQCGTNSVNFRACLLWNKLPNSLKESQSLPDFRYKYKIKTIGKFLIILAQSASHGG